MVKLYRCATPSEALKRLGDIAEKNNNDGIETAVFCDSKLTIEAEKAICDRVGGTFDISVYTFSGYLSRFAKPADVLSRRQSVMAVRKIIDENSGRLKLFKSLPADGAEGGGESKKPIEGVGVNAAESVYETISRIFSSGIKIENIDSAIDEIGKDLRPGAEGSSDDILKAKMEDLRIILFEYESYLESCGKRDKNERLSDLPAVLRDDPVLAKEDMVFFGYGEFSHTGEDILEAAMECAGNVYGVLVGGEDRLYANAACKSFEYAAKKCGIDLGPKAETKNSSAGDGQNAEEGSNAGGETVCDTLPQHLRRIIFDPSKREGSSRRDGGRLYEGDGRVTMYEAKDGAEEMEYIAAQIEKCMCESVKDDVGEGKKRLRYRDIAVTVSDVEKARKDVENMFARYDIPYYVDAKRSLSTHPLYAFVENFLWCAVRGAAPSYVDDVVASPYFPGRERDKIAFRNYMKKYGKYKGAVLDEADIGFFMPYLGADATEEEATRAGEKAERDRSTVEGVRLTFLKGLSLFDGVKKAGEEKKGVGKEAYSAAKALFGKDGFDVEKTTEALCDRLKEAGREEDAQFFAQAPEAILSVMEEAADLDDGLDCAGYMKVLESGIDEKKMSYTPAKLDAVFVCDISNTLLCDKRVVFAAGMTEDVPGCSRDTKLLSDGDKDRLLGLVSAFKRLGSTARQTNAIARETAALNVCSFSDRLYLGYPVMIDGTGHQRSEVFEYAYYAFSWNGIESSDEYDDGIEKIVSKVSELERADAAYLCGNLEAAVMWTAKNRDDGELSEKCAAVEKALEERYGERYDNLKKEATRSERDRESINVEDVGKLYWSSGEDGKKIENGFSPTTLETYFECPYKAFVKKGLRADGKADDDTQAADIGNLYHETFKEIADEYMDEKERDRHGLKEKDGFSKRAGDIAREKLENAPFKSLALGNKGWYDKKELVEEVTRVAEEVFEQIRCSKFDILETETWCDMELDGVYSISGRADRVDKTSDGKMVRVIDYKTGGKEASCRNYYLGTDLQLPLYLLAESGNPTPLAAGAFYLPAKFDYSKKGLSLALNGFCDGTDETWGALDEISKSGSEHIIAKCPAARKGDGKKDKTKKGDGKKDDDDAKKDENQAELKREEFGLFLEYGRRLALDGAMELSGGYILPSPGEGACRYCKLKGCCGFEVERDGEERKPDMGGQKITFDFVANSAREKTGREAQSGKKEDE